MRTAGLISLQVALCNFVFVFVFCSFFDVFDVRFCLAVPLFEGLIHLIVRKAYLKLENMLYALSIIVLIFYCSLCRNNYWHFKVCSATNNR